MKSHSIEFRKSCGYLSSCSSLPQNSLVLVSVIISSLSGGVGVVESCGVDSGAISDGQGLVRMMLAESLGVDGRMKEDVINDVGVGSVDVVIGMNLPRWSCHMFLAHIAA